MNRFVKWVVLPIGALVLLLVAVFALSRMLGPSDREERALAMMSERPLPAGRNAFAALWLMPWDVPPGQVDAIAAADVKRFSEFRPVSFSDTADWEGHPARTFASSARGQFPVHPDPDAGLPPPCGSGEPAACLQQVEAQLADYRRWREASRALIERAALRGFDYYRNPFESRLARPQPAFGVGARARRTSQALDFVSGQRQAALAGACHDIATWRRLGAGAGGLLARMYAFGTVARSTRLFAQMLAGSPPGQALPPACAAAFAPPRAHELSMCAAMKGEFVAARRFAMQASPQQGLFYDPRTSIARRALGMSAACSDAVDQAIFAGRRLPPIAAPQPVDFSCIGNPVGCIMNNIAMPAYLGYLKRARDAGAQMRLASTVYWLHTHRDDTRPLAQRLASRPPALRSAALYPVEIVDGGKALRIKLTSPAETHWQLPVR